MSEFDYIASVFADYADVLEGRKPLLIVSEGKSRFAADSIRRLAMESSVVQYELHDLVCEDRELHRHVFVCWKGAPYAGEAYDAILDGISEGCMTHDADAKRALRADVQRRVGALLGYRARDIEDFIRSDIGRSCPCDCCGSEFTVAPIKTDGNPGRFVEYAYRY